MSINYPISQVGGGGGVSAAEVSGAVTGGLDPIYSGSITLSGTKTLSGSLLVSGSEFSILGTTRSNVSVADDNLDIIVTGSNGAGTQILLDAKNDVGDSLIIAQAQTYVAAQAGTSGYPYYFVADSTNKFTAIEADDNTAGIYVGGTGYASSVNIGTAGSRAISIGNTSGSTQVIVSAGAEGTVITGALNVSGAITASVGGIKFPDGSIQTTAGGGGSTTLQQAYDNGISGSIATDYGKPFMVMPSSSLGTYPNGGVINPANVQLGLYSEDALEIVSVGDTVINSSDHIRITSSGDIYVDTEAGDFQVNAVGGNSILDADTSIQLGGTTQTYGEIYIGSFNERQIYIGRQYGSIYSNVRIGGVKTAGNSYSVEIVGQNDDLMIQTIGNPADIILSSSRDIILQGNLQVTGTISSTGGGGGGSWTDVAPNYTTTTKDVVVSGTLNTTSSNVWNKPQAGAINLILSVANTASVDLSRSNNFKFNINENCLLENPTGITEGQSGLIVINQPAGTNYTMSYGTFWKFASGSTNILTANSGAIDVLSYYVASSSYAICNLVRNFE